MKVEQVAEITGLSADWVRKFARRYNEKVSTLPVRFYDIFRRQLLAVSSCVFSFCGYESRCCGW